MIDTHCHLTHERFQDDLPQVLGRAGAAGVSGIVCIASDLDDARAARELAHGDPTRVSETGAGPMPEVWFTCGIHPHHASAADGDTRARLSQTLSSRPRPVAVGECGLDFHYDNSPRDVQLRVFGMQIELAAETGLPLVVHCRDAEEAMKPRVREAGEAGVRGVLHCFPGDLDLLETALASGWLVSFTGLVTFRSFDGEQAVRSVPADRYMLETDGPYLAPVPHRGQRNEPAFVTDVRDRVAELREAEPSRVEREADENARRFFGI